jgi:Fe2+ transport system protein B
MLLLLYNSCLAVYGVMAKELGARFANTFMVYSFVVGWVGGVRGVSDRRVGDVRFLWGVIKPR